MKHDSNIDDSTTVTSTTTAEPTSNTNNNNPTNTIADSKYDNLYNVTPRQLEKELLAAADLLALASAQQDIKAITHYQNVISKLSMLKIHIEHRARKEGKV